MTLCSQQNGGCVALGQLVVVLGIEYRYVLCMGHVIVHVHVHKYTHTHTHTHTYTHTRACTHTYMHMHTHTCTYTHACTHTHIHAYAHTHTQVPTADLSGTHRPRRPPETRRDVRWGGPLTSLPVPLRGQHVAYMYWYQHRPFQYHYVSVSLSVCIASFPGSTPQLFFAQSKTTVFFYSLRKKSCE